MSIEVILHLLKFDIRSNTLDIGDMIDRLYVSNDLRPLFPDRAARITLEVERKDSSAAARIDAPAKGVFAEANLCGARCYYEDGRFFSENHGDFWHEMDYDLNTRTIRANVGGSFCESSQAVISNMIRPILQSFILPFSGIKTIHGAVLTKDGRTIFLSGRGGSGKTTAALQLMRSGYTLLSDDGPFFFSPDGKAYAVGSLDYVHFTENTLSMFPELEPHVVGDKDSRGKYAARISDIQTSAEWKKPHQVTHYVQLTREGNLAVPRITPVSRNVVHRSLLDESMVIFRPSAFRGASSQFTAYSELVFDLLTRVVKGAQTYGLRYSDHQLPEIPMLVDEL